MYATVWIINGYLCHNIKQAMSHHTYHEILCYDMLYVMTIVASLIHTYSDLQHDMKQATYVISHHEILRMS